MLNVFNRFYVILSVLIILETLKYNGGAAAFLVRVHTTNNIDARSFKSFFSNRPTGQTQYPIRTSNGAFFRLDVS